MKKNHQQQKKKYKLQIHYSLPWTCTLQCNEQHFATSNIVTGKNVFLIISNAYQFWSFDPKLSLNLFSIKVRKKSSELSSFRGQACAVAKPYTLLYWTVWIVGFENKRIRSACACMYFGLCIHMPVFLYTYNINTKRKLTRIFESHTLYYRQLHCHRSNNDDTVA